MSFRVTSIAETGSITHLQVNLSSGGVITYPIISRSITYRLIAAHDDQGLLDFTRANDMRLAIRQQSGTDWTNLSTYGLLRSETKLCLAGIGAGLYIFEYSVFNFCGSCEVRELQPGKFVVEVVDTRTTENFIEVTGE